MQNLFNFSNLKDRSYLLLIISMALCLSLSQTILTPSLDYIALSIKNNNQSFYDYALIATLAATIPQASSIIAGYLINNLPYKRLIVLVCSTITALSIVMFFYQQHIALYAIFVIICGILLNALICGLDRQLVTLLAHKIRDFQNDLMILCTILAIINYKFSSYIFAIFGLNGIITYCVLLDCVIFTCLRSIPIIEQTITSDEPQVKLPNIMTLFKIILRHKKLITFIGIMYTMIFACSGLTLLLTTKIHHEHLSTTFWSSNMAFMAFGGLFGAIICKTRIMQQLNSILIVCIGEVIFGLCFIGVSQITSEHGIIALVWILGFVNPFILINMNTIVFKYISRHNDLIIISPVVNGLLTSLVYLACLIGPTILNPLLQFGIYYQTLLIACGVITISLAILLINIKNLRNEFI